MYTEIWYNAYKKDYMYKQVEHYKELIIEMVTARYKAKVLCK